MTTAPNPVLPSNRRAQITILATASAISVCGISYELLSGTISSFFLGNAVLQYSITIGLFLFAMGIGSYLSRKFERNLIESFLTVQILVGLVGGFSTFILFSAYEYTESFSTIFYMLILTLGTLIGLEVPLLIRIMKDYQTLKFSIADVLAFDYVGALLASLLFPLLILPHLGLMHGSFFYGLLSMCIVFLNMSIFWQILKKRRIFLFTACLVGAILFTGLIYSARIVNFFEVRLYADEIILSKQTKYQKIVVTSYGDDMRLYLDGNLQFSSWDEYRYHECLIHPAMNLTSNREEVLVLGGGDGLAVREILKYDDVKRVTLVDIDGDMVNLCKTNFLIKRLNNGALSDPRVNIVIEDAYRFLEKSKDRYGVIICDLPDPNNESLSKLYSLSFFRMVKEHLCRAGITCVQSTSPYFARQTFWCIAHTVERAGLVNRPFHAFVPSMGDWGFCLASDYRFDPAKIRIRENIPTRYLRTSGILPLFYFGKDEEDIPTEINTLNSHKLIQYYEKEWKQWE